MSEASAHLPGWVPWAPLLVPVLCAALTWALMWAADRALGGGRFAELSWPERAREGHQRLRGLYFSAYAALVVTACFSFLFAGAWTFAAAGEAGVPLFALACALGALMGSRGALRRARNELLGRELSAGEYARGLAVLLLVRYGHWLFIIGAMLAAPRELGVAHGLIILGLCGVSLAWMGGAGARVSGWIGWARPAPPELLAIAEAASAEAGVALRRCRMLKTHQANALALPLAGELLVTTALVEGLSAAQVRAVLDHEAGHLSESCAVGVVRAAVVMALSLVALLPAALSTWGPAAIGPFVLLWVVSQAVAGQVGRRMEERADAHARGHAQGGEGLVYASALEQIYRLNGTPAVMGGRRVHPDLYDRLLAAGFTPDYPRPAPPSWWVGRAASVGVAFMMVMALAAARIGLVTVGVAGPGARLMAAAIAGGDRAVLAEQAWLHDDPEARVALLQAALAAQPNACFSAMIDVAALYDAGACQEASDLWAHAHEGCYATEPDAARAAQRALFDCHL